jgi:hypothetical protein
MVCRLLPPNLLIMILPNYKPFPFILRVGCWVALHPLGGSARHKTSLSTLPIFFLFFLFSLKTYSYKCCEDTRTGHQLEASNKQHGSLCKRLKLNKLRFTPSFLVWEDQSIPLTLSII